MVILVGEVVRADVRLEGGKAGSGNKANHPYFGGDL